MISDEKLSAYLSGQLAGSEREEFENRLAKDPDALRQLVEQEKMDAALSMLLAKPDRARLKDSIMVVVEGPAETEVKSKIHEQVEFETKRKQTPARGNLWDWLKRLPAPIQMAALMVMAIGVFYLGKPNGNRRLTQADPNPATNSVQPPIKLPAKQPRDPVDWPFASTSPWNTPIGSAAQYAEPEGVNLAAGITLYDAHQVHPTIRTTTSPGAASIRLFRRNSPDPVAALQIAPSDVPHNNRDFAVVAADGKTLYDVTGGQLNGSDIVANNIVVADLTGSGIPGDYDAPTSTGFSDYAGSLCAEDFNGPIRRALGAVFHPAIITGKADGTAHTWPANKTPGNYEARFGSLRQTGNLHIGSLLAIPKSVDLASIGVGTSGPAFEIARAFQDYGLYLKKPLPGSADGPLLGMCGDLRSANLPPDFHQQLAQVAAHLKVVVNNGPTSIGGGGTPQRPQAPEFRK